MKQKISYLGIPGSYHSIIAHKLYPEINTYHNAETFEEIFFEVEQGNSHYGIIAIENSIAGTLRENYDLLLEKNLFIQSEAYLKISHHLLSLSNQSLHDIHTIASHPMAFKQCEVFLKQYPHIKRKEFDDTASAAKWLHETKSSQTAVIANEISAELYELKIIKSHIETVSNNFTRFIAIGKEAQKTTKGNKTSMVFSVKNIPGALSKVFVLFADSGINISKIESRPQLSKEWTYTFTIDFEASLADEQTQTVLSELSHFTDWQKILGYYEVGEVFE